MIFHFDLISLLMGLALGGGIAMLATRFTRRRPPTIDEQVDAVRAGIEEREDEEEPAPRPVPDLGLERAGRSAMRGRIEVADLEDLPGFGLAQPIIYRPEEWNQPMVCVGRICDGTRFTAGEACYEIPVLKEGLPTGHRYLVCLNCVSTETGALY